MRGKVQFTLLVVCVCVGGGGGGAPLKVFVSPNQRILLIQGVSGQRVVRSISPFSDRSVSDILSVYMGGLHLG